MLKRIKQRHPVYPATLGADRGYAAGAFLAEVERRRGTPHVPMPDVAIRGDDRSAAARRRARDRMGTAVYQVSQRIRKRIEEVFGWAKSFGGLRRARYVGRWKIKQQSLTTLAAYNLLRLAKLKPAAV